jgi:hypothetical protein
MTDKMMPPLRALRTTPAARYLGVSPSLLRKYRMRAPDDPGTKGPDFIRVSPYLIVYEIDELNRWLDSHRTRNIRAAS